MNCPLFVLVILDGWGLAPSGASNAISLAQTINIDKLTKLGTFAKLKAHGEYVGLPAGQVGNSEAGHMNIGAGRIVEQDSVRIDKSIEDGTFFKNPAFLEAILHAKNNNSTLHIMGIISGKQCPHMSPNHVVALMHLAKKQNVKKVILHFFTDGRDAMPRESKTLWQELKKHLPKDAKVGSVVGRVYLGRKKNWDNTLKVYDLFTQGKAYYTATSLELAIEKAHKRGETDEYMQPTMVLQPGMKEEYTRISDNDSVIFYNLRSDRARQLARPFVQKDFTGFVRNKIIKNLKFVAMTDFGPDLGDILTAYPSANIKNTLPFVLTSNVRQLYIAEMEKYAHITFFFNGGYSMPVAGENRVLVPSPDVERYAKTPKMGTVDITNVVFQSIGLNLYDFICINFSNADMLGHTGDIKATIKGIETIDKAIGILWGALFKKRGTMAIVADHGNAEVMRLSENQKNTMHEISDVPFVISGSRKIKFNKTTGNLADVAPTILHYLGIPIPSEMTGQNLFA